MKRISALFVCAALAFGIVGCSSSSGKDQGVISEDTTETTSEQTSITESEETVTETSASETTEEETETPPVIDISSDGYYTDCPLFLEDRTVYVRCVPGFDFYADSIDPLYDTTYYDRYLESNMTSLYLFSGPDAVDRGFEAFDPFVYVYLNSPFNIDWYLENADTGYEGVDNDFFEIGEPEVYENGIAICEIKVHFTYEYDDMIQTDYLLQYQIDDDNWITIGLKCFVANEWIDKDPIINSGDTSLYLGPSGYEEGLESVLEFYRTVEDPFLIVDKGTTVNFET